MAYQQQQSQPSSQPPAVKGHASRISVAGSSLGRSPQAPSTILHGVSPARPGAANVAASVVSAFSVSPSQHNSLEQSVRKFRIVEALRSGDTASITKVIRDTSPVDPSAPRASTSSFATTGAVLDDTTVLHLAIQCAEFPVVEYVLSDGAGVIDINARDKDGNTALHLAAGQGRTQVVRLLLEQKDINDALPNAQGRLPLDLARNPEIFQLLQLSRSLFTERIVQEVQELIARGDYKTLAQVLEEPRLKTVLDINSTEFVSDPITIQAGGTLLHEAARRKNSQLIQVLLLHGADPFRRDRKGKLPQDVTKDDITRAMLKKSPAAVAAQRGIQEKAVLGAAAQGGLTYGVSGPSSVTVGSAAGNGSLGTGGVGGGAGSGASSSALVSDPLAGREAREMKGYLKKWTNYRKGYQLRWFVLEDGVLSYYKHQDDAGSACRGAINMRIARLNMSADEKTKFEIIGKSSVKYTLKANHEVEAKRWFWALNNSIQWTKDQAKQDERQRARSAELLRQAKAEHTLQPQISHQSQHSQAISINNDTGTAGSLDDDDFVYPSSDAAAGRKQPRPAGTTATTQDNGEGDDANGNMVGGGLDDDDDDDDLDASSGRDRDAPSATRDALNITAQSARLQLEAMAQVNQALVGEATRNPALTLSDAKTSAALSTYDAAIRSLTGLIGDLMRISRDRDAFWQYRLDREVEMRRMWEESMAQVAREQEALEARVGQAEEKKKSAKRILKEVIDSGMLDDRPASSAASPHIVSPSLNSSAYFNKGVVGTESAAEPEVGGDTSAPSINMTRRMTVIEQVAAAGLSDSESDDEEFFDAVDAGEVPVMSALPSEATAGTKQKPSGVEETEEEGGEAEKGGVAGAELVVSSGMDISKSFKGYENGIRSRLKIDADNRPKLSLWVSIPFMTHLFAPFLFFCLLIHSLT